MNQTAETSSFPMLYIIDLSPLHLEFTLPQDFAYIQRQGPVPLAEVCLHSSSSPSHKDTDTDTDKQDLCLAHTGVAVLVVKISKYIPTRR